MSGSDTNIQWFIARDGKQHGPISDVEIRKLVELSHLKPTDLVWCQGFSDWRSAGSVFPIPEASHAPAAPSAAPAQSQPAAQSAAPSPAFGPQSASPASTSPVPAASGPGASGTAANVQPGALSVGMGPGPSGAAPQPYSPFAGSPQSGPRPAAPIDSRAAPTRPLGNPIATGPSMGPGPGMPGPGPGPGMGPGPGPRQTTDMRRPAPIAAPPRAQDAPRAGKRRAVVAAGLVAMTAAGAWLASQYKDQIFSFVESTQDADKPESETQQAAATDLLPAAKTQDTATATPVAAVAPAPGELDRKLQARTMWVAVKQQFPERYQEIVAQGARLTAEGKAQSEITGFLVTELVKMRRENAPHALAASTARHKELAAAFLANLNALSKESGDGCYEFISRGENSQAILSRIDDPARSTEIEAQVVAIVQAIVEGKAQPAAHPPPVKTDYDVLAGELGRLGWTQADMQLFANPKELAKAPRSRVCSMLKDWFTAHLAIQDPSTQERLLFETLKPVVAG